MYTSQVSAVDHVTDIGNAGQDASVLTDAGSGGFLGRAVLSEGPLADHLEDDETPQYVLRNKKRGVTVERSDGTDEYPPDRRHSGAVVVSDVRVLFAAGRTDDDVTLSVSLTDVVDVRIEEGLIGGAFVVETVTDERYRFPCRGDLEPVQEYLDAAVGVWTRAQRHVEEAREQVDRLRDAFESGDAEAVLAATGDVEETLADAREVADALDGARRQIDGRAATVREELAALERRAHAEYAEGARERAHARYDDGDYEAAMDSFEEAAESYLAARDVDADEPSDDLLAERRETLTEERDRLAGAPVDRAEHAVDVATTATDPASATDWWETAVQRYETALSLDWGRENRRFAGDPETLRDDLARATRELVATHCDRAREQIADGDETRAERPERARAAYASAAEALAAAREVTRERVPEAADEVDAVAATLEDRLDDLPGDGDTTGANVESRLTATATRSSDEEQNATDEDSPTGRETAEPPPAVDENPDHLGETETVVGTPGRQRGDAGTGGVTPSIRSTGDGPDADPESARITDPTAVDPDALPSLVARVFESAGWSTTVFTTSARNRYDLLAATDEPVSVTVCVWVVHPDTVETVDATTVERYVSYFQSVEDADAAALCSAAPVSETARARATDEGLELVDSDDLTALVESLGLDPGEF